MLYYLENFQTNSYTYKQETWKQFAKWVGKIEKKYHIPENMQTAEFVEKSADCDAVIAVVKALHGKGKTVEEISRETNMGIRTVQKWLKKLDCHAENAEEIQRCCKIAGQPVNIQITTDLPSEGTRAPRYRTINTMHPLVLQENLMQIGTLLKALAHDYNDENSDISFSIGLDIWCQLSDYARKRVKFIYAKYDEALKNYLKEIEMVIPDASAGRFFTERELVEETPLSYNDLLIFVMKGKNRRCNLYLNSPERELYNQDIFCSRTANGLKYQAVSENGTITEFSIDEVDDIEIAEI